MLYNYSSTKSKKKTSREHPSHFTFQKQAHESRNKRQKDDKEDERKTRKEKEEESAFNGGSYYLP